MADESVLQQGSLLGRLMLDYDTTNELGLVDSLLVNLAQGQVVGLVGKGPLWQRQRPIYSWSQVANIGQDSIVLRGQGTATPSTAAQPMVGLEVWTDTGNCVGQIVDYRFERQGTVVKYLFTQPHQPGLYGLAPDAIISAGRKRIMVSAPSVEQAEYFTDEAIPLDPQDWQTTAQALAEQVQQRTQGLSNYAQEKWLTEDLNQQIQDKTRQIQDKTQGLRTQLNQQVSKAKKRLSPLNKALENTLGNTLDQFSPPTNTPAIDVDSFEVWEDDD
ncbi:hypothetical protein [Leptothoe sp. PORK10 BA2]|uniref:hypothetical protein n=1 Tax=Leptothoe sp. PORK10 BA2 TaxID=3110254 RepID=UPI002B218B3D|nr:hypothetical protein [Leptothoe sp. PORK10 BA2]MEA5464546.1 hypothetical protein [Leptothoe sp. PORK10 BA2]